MKTTLTDGSPVTPDHRDIDPATGLQKAYVVLSAEERAKGFVQPVRHSYTHDKCQGVTTMGIALAETYARQPDFYSGTYCATCGGHFPVGADGEFAWAGTAQKVGTVAAIAQAAQPRTFEQWWSGLAHVQLGYSDASYKSVALAAWSEALAKVAQS